MLRDRTPAVLLAAFLLALTSPVANAQGGLLGEPPAFPDAPEGNPVGSQPVDRWTQEVHGQAQDLYDGPVRTGYSIVSDGGAQVRDAVLPDPLVLLRDGAGGALGGPDSLFALGTPRTYGPAGWVQSPGAARTGMQGYALATDDQGRYPTASSGMLLTSEIDLNTGANDLNPAATATQVNNLVNAGSIYSAIFADLEPELTFAARFNLGQFTAGAGRDGVTVMLFTAPPTQIPAGPAACTQTCTLVQPTPSSLTQTLGQAPTPAYNGSIGAFAGANGFTGFQDWQTYSIDLRPWLGRSIWIGFYFASMAPMGAAYFDGPFFDQAQPFRGFHLDDILVTGPGTYDNVQVRPLRQPSLVPLGQALPTLPPGEPIPVATEVRNTGWYPATVAVGVALSDAATGAPLQTRNLDPVTLPPGAFLRVEESFGPLPAGTRAIARVSFQRVTGDPQADPVGTARQATPSDPGDARPADDARQQAFNVLLIRTLLPSALAREEPATRVGETLSFALTLQNVGNVREQATLEATVVDVSEPGRARIVTDLLRPEQVVQSVDLGLGESRMLNWDLTGNSPGQYRLFVRDTRDAPFDPFDLVAPHLRPLDVPFVNAPVTIDGTLGEPAWSQAAAFSRQAVNPNTDAVAPITIRALHDGAYLYLAVTAPPCPTTVTAAACAAAASGLRALFDSNGDGRAMDGQEDGLLVSRPVAGNPQSVVDLTYRNATTSFGPDASQAGATGDAFVLPGSLLFELRRPLGRDPDDLRADNGLAGVFLEVTGTAIGINLGHWPAGAQYLDGGLTPAGTASSGLGVPDGSLDDELAAWQLLRLSPTPAVLASEVRVPIRLVSSGVGVELGPPPLFLERVDDCNLGRGWVQRNVVQVQGASGGWTQRFDNSPHTEKWGCAPIGPAGRDVLYMGLAQDPATRCLGAPCDPVATLGSGGRPNATLTTPPVEIGDAANPWLLIEHQQDHWVWVCDGPYGFGHILDQNPCPAASVGGIRAKSVARVSMDYWNPSTRQWGNSTILLPARPDGSLGYPDEAGVGIADARYGSQGRRWAPGGGDACLAGRTPGMPALPMQSCGWWDPSGWLASYRGQNASIPLGGDFAGSPWRVDRIPLFGMHGPAGTTPVFVQGQTVRFHFQFVRPSVEPPVDVVGRQPYDLGWRIGTVAVLEGPRFQRDLAVEAVEVATDLFDPAVLGLAPGTAVPVRVVVRNEGEQSSNMVRVRAAIKGTQGPLALCESPEIPVEGVLLPGDARSVVALCELPEQAEGFVRLVGTVAALDGDAFPHNNRREGSGAYALRASPDVAVLVGATPTTASEAAVRNLFVTLENRGNVPLSGVEVAKTVLLRVGVRGGELLGSESGAWSTQGELPVGGSLALNDEDLGTLPAVLAARDLVFDPPEPGTFDVTVRVSVPGDIDPSNDVAQATLESQREVLADTFDALPVMRDGFVSGAWSTDGEAWTLRSDGDRHGRHYVAGGGTGDIAPHADDALLLPPLDLSSLRGATLTFLHRYDLERNFDAGRVEASVDGGATWLPLTPRPQPLAGLPAGYPSETLYGPHPLLDGRPQGDAVAFTGRSADLAGAAQDGYMPVEFDLAGHPGLRRETGLEAFRFDELASRPTRVPLETQDGDLQFRHPSWTLREPEAEGRQRFWWVDNQTAGPQPASGVTAWWSGAAGEVSAQHPSQSVCNGLQTRLDLPALATRQDERVVLQWWDWRFGWEEDPEGRAGTGGGFAVNVRQLDTDGDAMPDSLERQVGTDATLADTDGDGWTDGSEHFMRTRITGHAANPLSATATPRSQDLGTGYAADSLDDGWETHFFVAQLGSGTNAVRPLSDSDPDGDGLTNHWEQHWYSHPLLRDQDRDGLPDAAESRLGTNPRDELEVRVVQRRPDGWTLREVDLTPFRGEAVDVLFSYTSQSSPSTPEPLEQKNLGWLIDDVSVRSWIEEPGSRLRSAPLDVLPLQDQERLDYDPRSGRAGPWEPIITDDTCSGTSWSLVARGAPATPGGWHVAQGVEVPGQGRSAAWRFAADNEQGYPHLADSRLVTPLVDLTQVAGAGATLRFNHRFEFEALRKSSPADPNGQYWSAFDGGAVEYQVFDSLTGTYGPWKQLFSGGQVDPMAIALNGVTVGSRTTPGLLSPTAAEDGTPNRALLASLGYNAIEERGTVFVAGVPPQHGGSTAVALSRFQGGHGYTLERFPGYMQHPSGGWFEYPVSYLFSGASEGVDGWREESWDISGLVGQHVRFAFHAVSNPSYSNPQGDGRLFGWAISDIGIDAEMFRGAPVLVRMHVGTDGSMTRGSWDVDDVRIVGSPFSRNLVLESDQGEILSRPAQEVPLEARLANLASTPRAGLALAVRVLDDQKRPVSGWDLLEPQAASIASGLPAEFADAAVFGPFALTPVGQEGHVQDVRLDVRLPAGTSRREVVLTVLENQGTPSAPQYRVPDNQLSGATSLSWSIVGEVRQDLRLPAGPRGHAVAMDLEAPEAGEDVTFTAQVANEGTTRPDVSVAWRILEIERKGPAERLGDWSHASTQNLGPLDPGESAATQAVAAPPHDGLFRAVAEVRVAGRTVASAQREFLVGPGGVYHSADFGISTLEETGWSDRSPLPGNSGGGTPPESAWRLVEGQLLWGVTPAALQSGMTYCNTPNAACHATNQNTQGTPPDYFGMEGIAVSPPVDLTRVPDQVAFLSLRSGHTFEANDGGVVEVVPLATPVDPDNPVPLYTCASAPVWFTIAPQGGYPGVVQSRSGQSQGPVLAQAGRPAQSAFTAANRLNPLVPTPMGVGLAIGGAPMEPFNLRFDLGQLAQSSCTSVPDMVLENQTVQFRLHVGTRPGTLPGNPPAGPTDRRNGAAGWQVEAVQVSSVAFSVLPMARVVPVVDGAAKTFSLQLRNDGPVPDAYTLEVDEATSTLPDAGWIQLPQGAVEVGPGGVADVLYTVDVPSDYGLSRGSYAATIVARSARDPLATQAMALQLVLDPNPLPDLELQVVLDADGTPPTFEAGTIAPVHANVFNVGQVASRPATMRIRAIGTDHSYERTLGTIELPALCPAPVCGAHGSRVSASVEWSVPLETGTYELVAEVDPDGRVLEARRDNNVRMVVTRAVPLQRPDVLVEDLRVLGTGPDGMAEEGSLVQVVANVTNAGNVPAENVQVRLMAGTSELGSVVLPVINPGDRRTLTAFKAVSAGEVVLGAVVVPSAAETDVENNVLSRLLRVRGYDLALAGPTANLTADEAGAATFDLVLENRAEAVGRFEVAFAPGSARGWAIGVLPNPVVVPPGGNATALVRLQAPDGVPGGTHALSLVARSATKPGFQVPYAFNVTVPLRHDAPALGVGNATASPGWVDLPFRLASRANTAQRLDMRLAAPAWVSAPHVVEIAPGGVLEGTLRVQVPAAATPGEHAVTLAAVRNGTAEALSTGTGRVRVLPHAAADADWQSARLGSHVLGATQVDYALAVTNTGNTPVHVEARPRDLAPGRWAPAAITGPAPLAPGDRVVLDLPVTVRADAPPGRAGTVDVWDIGTSPGGPARRLATLEFPDPARTSNLVLQALTLPQDDVAIGRDLVARLRIENRGAAASPPTNLSAYIDGVLVDDLPVPALEPGAHADLRVAWTAVRPGRHLLTVVADGRHDVLESSEDDNGASAELTIVEGDLGDRVHRVPGPAAPLALAALAALTMLRRRWRPQA